MGTFAPLRALAPDLWVVDRPLRFGGLAVGARMTVIRLAGGELVLHSPIAIDDALHGELERLGRPRYAIAPNRFHHLYVGAVRDHFPDALVVAAPGLPAKRPDLRFDGVLGDDPAPWSAELAQHHVAGAPMLHEVVFLHHATRTLIATDLAFHIGAEAPWGTRLVFRLIGAYGKLGPTPLERLLIRDRAAARACLEQILAWDFDRVIVAHGTVIEHGGREALRRGYAWLLDRPQLPA